MKPAVMIIKILLVLSYCVFSLFFNVLGGTAIISGAMGNAQRVSGNNNSVIFWGISGAVMILSSAVMLAALIMVLKQKIRPAVVLETTGLVMCMTVLAFMVFKASETGVTNGDLVPYKNVYLTRHLPTVLHSFLLYLYAFIISGRRKSK